MNKQFHKAWVQGLLTFGLLWAIFSLSSVIQGEGSEALSAPNGTTTSSATPTLTATLTVTPTVTITPTLTITPTVTMTPTLTITPTLEPTPTPVLTVTLWPQNYLPVLMIDPSPTPTPTATPTPTPWCVPPPDIPPSNLNNEAAIRDGINQQRYNNGLPHLALAAELTQSSRRHSLDMAANHFTGHIGSDGTSAGDRMRQACYNWNYWGEIIGWGFGGDTNAMLNWWMNSAPHRALILNSFVQDFGAGYIRLPGSDWTHYWTVNFGRRAAGPLAEGEVFYLCEYRFEGEMGGASLRIFSPEPCVDE
jgi:uncharacterized protein YkwD